MTNDGALAQLGERLHGMQEVSGSIPLGSTIILYPQKFRASAPAHVTSDALVYHVTLASCHRDLPRLRAPLPPWPECCKFFL